MDLMYKEDWPEARERLTAWWHREVVDRVCVQVYAPRKGYEHAEKPPYRDLEQYWTDYDYIREEMLHTCRTRFFGGEAVPVLQKLGSPKGAAKSTRGVTYREDTVWHEPVITDWDNVPPVGLDPDSEWFEQYLKHYQRVVDDAYGYYYVPLSGIAVTGDTLSSLRGNAELCMDLILNPDKVKETENELLGDKWRRAYDRIWDVISSRMDGMAYWWLAWAPGRSFCLQNDFSFMISNEMFREFFLDNLVKQIKHIDYSMYHLDGVEAIRHLDSLLEIEELDAIQFIPGTGSKGYLYYIDVLKKILNAGKSTFIVGVSPKEMEQLMAELPHEGLMFSVYCWNQEQGEQVLKDAARLTRPRRRAY